MANDMDRLVIAKITQKVRAGYSVIEVPISLLERCSPEGLQALKEMRMAWEIDIKAVP